MSQAAKIAVVEDDMTISQMYRMKLSSVGFDVQTAENGKLGVELCANMRPDMILMDLRMPEMSGEEAIKEIRATDWGKTTPIIVLTNLGEEEAPDSLKTLGIHSYIVKAELTPSQVTERVKQALAGKAPAAEAAA